MVQELIEKFELAGYCKDYTSTPGAKSDVISIEIPTNGAQRIYLPQNSLLDNATLTCIEVVPTEVQIYGFKQDGTTIENIPTSSLNEFAFTLAIDTEDKFTVPFTGLNSNGNGGKYSFISSVPGEHRIGDSYIDQFSATGWAGQIITLRFWYND